MQPRCSTAQSTGDRRYTRGRHKLGTPRLRHHTPLCEANAGLTPHRASVDGPADRGGDAPRLKPMWPVRLYRWHYCLCVVDEKPIEAQVIASIGFWCAVSSPAFFVATIDDAQGEPQPGYRVYQYVAAGDCIAIVGPHSAARPKQRLRASPTTAADVSPTRRCSAPYTQRSGCASGSRACPETADAGPATGPPTPTTDATPAQQADHAARSSALTVVGVAAPSSSPPRQPVSATATTSARPSAIADFPFMIQPASRES